MKSYRVQRALGVTLCLSVFGCATMREDLVKTDVNVLKTTERQDAKKSFLVVATQKGNVFELHTADACSRRKVLAKEEIKHFENKNGSVAADVTWGILGGLSAGAGVFTLVDAQNVGASSTDTRVFNPVGQPAALGLGIGAVVLGAGLLTIPLVDGIRASKARDERRLYSEDGPVVAAHVPPSATPATNAGAAMWASMADTSRSSCEHPGSLEACELIKGYTAHYPESKYAIAAKKLVVDAEPTFERLRDDRAFAAASAEDCKKATSEDACDAVEAYMSARPSGLHVEEAKAALKVGQPKVRAMIAKREAAERAEAARVAREAAQEAARQRAEEAREAAAAEARDRNFKSCFRACYAPHDGSGPWTAICCENCGRTGQGWSCPGAFD